jgi:pyruvate formate lyase activating enzyme
MDRLMDQAAPDEIARAAEESGCKSVAFTYNDPVIFAEYAMDTADACHARGIQTVAVTAGYIHAEPRREFYAKLDAANVDLKAFTDEFYFKLTGAHLAPVLDTLRYIKHETNTWLEITTLLIPGKNDSDAELEAMTQLIANELAGCAAALQRLPSGLQNDRHSGDPGADPQPRARHCHEGRIALRLHRQRARHRWRHHLLPVVPRIAHRARLVRIELSSDADGHCPDCQTQIAGHFEKFTHQFGNRRVPIAIHTSESAA